MSGAAAAAAGVAGDAGAPRVVEPGPFKFLDHYDDTPEDRLRFGGREREVREITARIANQATLILYGRSGIGKTSLLLAGVFPELRDRGYRPIYVRTLTAPLDDLRRTVARECGLGDPGGGVHGLLARAAAAGPIVLVLDQFEEFFVRFRDQPAARAELISAVAAVVKDQELDVTVVFSLREDYLAELDDFRRELPGLFENEYRLRALTAFGVRQARAGGPERHRPLQRQRAVLGRPLHRRAHPRPAPGARRLLERERTPGGGRRRPASSPRLRIGWPRSACGWRSRTRAKRSAGRRACRSPPWRARRSCWRSARPCASPPSHRRRGRRWRTCPPAATGWRDSAACGVGGRAAGPRRGSSTTSATPSGRGRRPARSAASSRRWPGQPRSASFSPCCPS